MGGMKPEMFWPAYFKEEMLDIMENASFFRIDKELCYFAFCDSFGPMDLAAVYRFCTIVESQVGALSGLCAPLGLPVSITRVGLSILTVCLLIPCLDVLRC
jgi:hypothetical protein